MGQVIIAVSLVAIWTAVLGTVLHECRLRRVEQVRRDTRDMLDRYVEPVQKGIKNETIRIWG